MCRILHQEKSKYKKKNMNECIEAEREKIKQDTDGGYKKKGLSLPLSYRRHPRPPHPPQCHTSHLLDQGRCQIFLCLSFLSSSCLSYFKFAIRLFYFLFLPFQLAWITYTKKHKLDSNAYATLKITKRPLTTNTIATITTISAIASAAEVFSL